ncbi:FAD-binding protein [candidate division WOR-3 bacterium]|uniref:FAD-binding protein n=1 Tax=candidate division WOR-3 bacterium TaxID=2052148 RepID=A0A9D5KCB0_UNCW3|nr:FAD-binding protein [candidate division WOR-3 bacterium]MBD3365425.1 FAD-binding protein [candidate division WOR-3 bacterium]
MEFSFSVSGPSKVDLADSYDLVIIGGGPTGLTAAIYSSRANLHTLIVEKGAPGGLVATTEWIENYPGFPEGVAGPELGRAMQQQAQRFGAEIFHGEPEGMDLRSNPKKITLGGKPVTADAVIIATGTRPRKLGVPGEVELAGRGVSYCATCDGPFFQDKELVAVGAGNSGVQESVFLAKFASKITIVEYLPTIQAEKILVDRFNRTGKGSFLLNHEVISIEGEGKVSGVRVRDRESGKEKVIPCSGVFIWVGLKPQTEGFKGLVKLDEWGYVEADEELRTDIEGVWAAGDVVSGAVRQIAAAVGSGAKAAIGIEHYLSTKPQKGVD